MHELGIVINIIRSLENFVKKNGVSRVDTLVLQIGELSSVVPKYIESCYPAAVDGTMFEATKLKIEIVPGNVICKNCSKVFNLVASNLKCPQCQGKNVDILSGKEFMIKEIIAC